MAKFTWLVTGYSSVHTVLARGDNVIATAQNNTGRLKHLEGAGATVFEFDVTAPQLTIDAKTSDMLHIYGGVDVLVNNAGHIEAGIVEEVR